MKIRTIALVLACLLVPSMAYGGFTITDGGSSDTSIIMAASVSWDQNVETLSGTKTMVITDMVVQKLDPNGATRQVWLPTEGTSTDLLFVIMNTANGVAENLRIKEDTGTTLIAEIGPEQAALVHCDGTTWKWLTDAGFYYDAVGETVSFGSATPATSAELDVTDINTGNGEIHLRTFSTDADRYSRLRLRKSKSNTEAMVETDASTYLGIIQFEGSNTTPVFAAGARIWAQQSAAAGGQVPSYLALAVSNDEFNFSRQLFLMDEGLTALNARHYAIEDPEATLHVYGATWTALTGTVTATNSSDAVEGAGTSFTTELVVGDAIKIESDYGSAQPYEIFTIDGITDNDTLSVDSNYQGTTQAGMLIYEDHANLFKLSTGDSVDRWVVTKAGTLAMTPAGAGPANIIDITPSAALTIADAEWDGIHIDGSALDPSAAGVDTDIHGIHIDMSGVLRTYADDIQALHLEGADAANVAGQYEPGLAIHSDGKILIDFDSTQSDTDRHLTIVDIIVDTTGVTAGTLHAIDVAPAGGGSGTIAALGTHTGIDVIAQNIGAFQATGANYACEQTGGGTVFDDNVNGETVFVDDDDTIVIGAAATFDEIEIILGTPATKDCFLNFFYNTAINTYVQFFPADDTEGMTQSGTIRFEAPAAWTADGDPDAGGGAADAGYWIKIQRTRVSNPGTVIITTVKTLAPTHYGWDASGDITASSITVDTITVDRVTSALPTLLASELDDTSDPHTLIEAELQNTILTNSESMGPDEWDFPVLAEGRNFMFVIEAVQNVTLDAPGAETWYLNGVIKGAGVAITNAAPTVGEIITCISTESNMFCESNDPDWQ